MTDPTPSTVVIDGKAYTVGSRAFRDALARQKRHARRESRRNLRQLVVDLRADAYGWDLA